jgi:hypothetical protein
MEELGAERLVTSNAAGKKGKGSIRYYSHPLLAKENVTGNFTIHVQHKKREYMWTLNFKTYVYPVLKHIIELLQEEDRRGKS